MLAHNNTNESSASFKRVSVRYVTFWFLSVLQLIRQVTVSPETLASYLLVGFLSCSAFDLSGPTYFISSTEVSAVRCMLAGA